jgi:hypothetical protein
VQTEPDTRSSLELATKLDRASVPNEVEARWLLNLYPEAAEASGCLVSPRRPWHGRGSWEVDEDRSASEAIRRARGAIRRYCAANVLNRLGTLTYAGSGCHDPRAFRSDLAGFFRRLKADLGTALPYLWVPEWHKTGHGLHAHFAVGRFVGRRRIEAAWGHGFVHIKLLGDLPVGSGAIGEARKAAGYLSKYVGKDLGPEGGLHRYDVAQGFQPNCRRLRGTSLADVLAQATAIMGRPPVEVWDSADVPGWDRPHAVRATWA